MSSDFSTRSYSASLGAMARPTVPGTAAERLTQSLFDRHPQDPFAVEVAAWLAASARFRSFAEKHHDKIRKKLRAASDAQALRDVRTELLVAHLLLADRRIELAFEAYGSGKAGPDFTVTFRGRRSFNLEVTRQQRTPAGAGADGGQLLAKLRQLPPSAPNAVLVAIDGHNAQAFDVAAATRALRNRADAKDEEFFMSRGFEGTRGFYDRYLRLGAVVVLCEGTTSDARIALWSNRSARIPLPEPALGVCILCLRA
jgi:hypothetical protein